MTEKNRLLHRSLISWLTAVAAADTDECQRYPGRLNRNGYGSLCFRGRLDLAHRVAFIMAIGEIPEGLSVLHKCKQQRDCCNPRHLYAGTHRQNMDDKVRDGTLPMGDDHWTRRLPELVARGDRNGSRTHPEMLPRGDAHAARTRPAYLPRGSSHGMARLTEEQVLAIRERAQTEVQKRLSEEFKVSPMTISLIVRRKIWAHL